MTEWQPIESAPRGRRIIVHDRFNGTHVAIIDGYGNASVDYDEVDCVLLYPTHWLPWPEDPPAT